MNTIKQTDFVQYREPLLTTVFRTATIALIPALIKCFTTHNAHLFAAYFFGALWFSFGGHWVEIAWLDGIRHRLPKSCRIQKIGRITYWFVSGIVLGVFMALTIKTLDPGFTPNFPPSLLILSGVAFVLIELLVHSILLQRRGRPSFYNSAG